MFNEYPLPTAGSGPIAITAGPDGALWFIEYWASKIGRITTSGAITEYPTPTANSFACCIGPAITVGPDGALWFTEFSANNIGRITTSGAITEYPVPGTGPAGITAGPDGALWFTEFFGNRIGRISTGGAATGYSIPTTRSSPENITVGPDGALWFTETDGWKVGRITTTGVLTEYPVSSGPSGITPGPDGALWFAEYGADKIGRITTPSSGASPTATTTSGPTATRTAIPIATSTPTPPSGTSATGGRGFAVASGSVLISWEAGTTQTSYLIAKITGTGVTALPPGSVLPRHATSYLDTSPLTELSCYALLPLGGAALAAIARSDLLCVLPVRSAAGAPRNFKIQLNQSNMARLTWDPPLGGAAGYALHVLGPSPQVIPLPVTTTSFTHDTHGSPTIYLLAASAAGGATGLSDALMGVPGFASFP